jgi:hypothetical protein
MSSLSEPQLPYVTLREVAQVTGLKYTTLRGWVDAGVIECWRSRYRHGNPYLLSSKQALVMAAVASLHRTLGLVGNDFLRTAIRVCEAKISDAQVIWWVTSDRSDLYLDESLACLQLKATPPPDEEMTDDQADVVLDVFYFLDRMRQFLRAKYSRTEVMLRRRIEKLERQQKALRARAVLHPMEAKRDAEAVAEAAAHRPPPRQLPRPRPLPQQTTPRGTPGTVGDDSGRTDARTDAGDGEEPGWESFDEIIRRERARGVRIEVQYEGQEEQE